jgi:hypothetical protein
MIIILILINLITIIKSFYYYIIKKYRDLLIIRDIINYKEEKLKNS